MATTNFRGMNYGLPMICGRTYGQIKEDYSKEFGEDENFNEDMFVSEEENDLMFAVEIAEEFSANLMFHNVTVESGYYSSFQFYVEEKYNNLFDMDKKSKYCIDNDDAHYYFDMCRSKALEASDAEKRKISKWLHGLTKYGFNEVVCTGIFSNGEGLYEIATPRTRLIAAVNQ